MTDRNILPDNVRPSHYALSLKDLDFKNWTYKGSVSIDSEITKPTKEIILNTLDLKLHNAKVNLQSTKASQALESTKFSYDDKAQRVAIAFDQELPVSQRATLIIDFEGIINNDLAGFYRSKYKPVIEAAKSVPRDDQFHYMFSTQFESCDARRAFPCFDEPNLKATFDLEIEIPSDQVALSNMPVKDIKPSKDGLQVVSFQKTPVMSTYLLAWALGDFEYVEKHTERRYNGKQIPVRVYTTRGLKHQGEFALEHAPKAIDFFSEIFDIDYPLPKSDLLAVHEFTHGAMENWGLVTYRTSQVLFDEKTSAPRFKNHIAYVVCHELAHQWFGNLVTMDWWDELWLNEGFATWVGWHAVDHMHPDWQVWAQFVDEGMQNAFELDSIRASHPIHVPVQDALDVNQIFDPISYLKGCSAIRMIANHLGTDVFLKGVSDYLKEHAYGNAKTQALWDALGRASGRDVAELMHPWISKIGHPVLTVAEEPGQITVKQSRFLSTGDVKQEDDTTKWWVPLGLSGKKNQAGVQSISMFNKEDTIRDVDDDFYLLNTGATGFYRVNYPADRMTKLGTQLDKLDEQDKIAIIGSAAALSSAGGSTPAALLSFLQGCSNESHCYVWRRVLSAIDGLRSVFGEDEKIRQALDKFTVKLADKKVKEVGFRSLPSDDYLASELRTSLIREAVISGHPEVTAEAASLFDAWVEDPEKNPILPSLRSPVWRAGLAKDVKRGVQILMNEWRNTHSIDGKLFALAVLGSIKDIDIINKELIPFLFNTDSSSDSVPAADMHILGSNLADNPVARPLLWQYYKDNYTHCVEKLGNPIVVDRFVRVALSSFTTSEQLQDVDRFFQDKDTSSFNRTLEIVKDTIRGRAAYRERATAVLKEWLSSNGHA